VRNLYTAEDLERIAAKGERRLALAPGDTLTPLARDRAAELGVAVEFPAQTQAPERADGRAGGRPAAGNRATPAPAESLKASSTPSSALDPAALRKLYRTLFTVRELEERLEAMAKEHKTKGALHLCVGQEAVGVGAGAALTRQDVVTSTHRGHAHLLGKGLDLRTMCAELWGKAEGQNRGRAGHQLMSDPKVGLLGVCGIVGGNVPVATGQALAFKMRRHPAVVCAFFGDGAVNIGHVHESLNLAALWKLPIIFVCDHNQYGLTVHASQQIAIQDVVLRAPGYGMPGYLVDGNDALAMYDVVSEARARALAG
jgi:pyruvate dehydrogenase E1 component alpha subunit